MNAFPANFNYIPNDEYIREQENLQNRVSVDELEDEQFLTIYGLFPEAGREHGPYSAIKFNALVETTLRDRDILSNMGTAALQFLVYPEIITDDVEPVFGWSAFAMPDLRPKTQRKNDSPLVNWVFPSEKPVIFNNNLKLRMGFLSHITLDTHDLATIEQYANQKGH